MYFRSLIILAAISLPLFADSAPLSPDEVLEQQRPAAWPEWVDVEMDSTILVDPLLKKAFADSLSQGASLFIEVSDESLFGEDGIYVKEAVSGKGGGEVPAKVVYRHPEKKGFTIKCGISLHGRDSLLQCPKRNFRLRFTEDYGQESLGYPLFSGKTERFTSLLLRSPARDSWAPKWESWRTNPRYVNDRWALETARSLGHLTPRQEWVHVYLNQIYWGAYTLGERPDESFAAMQHGGIGTDYDVFNGAQLTAGSDVQRKKAVEFLTQGFEETPEGFEQLERFLDLPAFMDHLICQIYQGKLHWPDVNYTLIGRRESAPRFSFGAWNSESGFYEELTAEFPSQKDALYFSPLSSTRFLSALNGPGLWYRYLSSSQEFRLMLADRLQLLIDEGGMLSPKVAAARYRRLLDEVRPFLLPESLRWGDAQRQTPYTPHGEEWESLTGPESWLFTRFFPLRPVALKKHFSDEGIWPDVEPPTHFTRLGRKGKTKFYLKNINPRGIIVFTTDGTDPREKWTGKPIGTAFREHLVLESGTHLKARILNHKTWSALMTYQAP